MVFSVQPQFVYTEICMRTLLGFSCVVSFSTRHFQVFLKYFTTLKLMYTKTNNSRLKETFPLRFSITQHNRLEFKSQFFFVANNLKEHFEFLNRFKIYISKHFLPHGSANKWFEFVCVPYFINSFGSYLTCPVVLSEKQNRPLSKT